MTPVAAATPPERVGGASEGLVLSTWKQLLDQGTMQDGDKHLAATARPAVAKVVARGAATPSARPSP